MKKRRRCEVNGLRDAINVMQYVKTKIENKIVTDVDEGKNSKMEMKQRCKKGKGCN